MSKAKGKAKEIWWSKNYYMYERRATEFVVSVSEPNPLDWPIRTGVSIRCPQCSTGKAARNALMNKIG